MPYLDPPPLLSSPLSHHSHSAAAAAAATAQWRIIIDRTRKTLARSLAPSAFGNTRGERRGREGEDTTTMMFLISSSECTAAAHRTRVTRTMEAPYEEEGEEAEQLQS